MTPLHLAGARRPNGNRGLRARRFGLADDAIEIEIGER
jgi:hypothetical protein